jgi:hypothetical protein
MKHFNRYAETYFALELIILTTLLIIELNINSSSRNVKISFIIGFPLAFLRRRLFAIVHLNISVV